MHADRLLDLARAEAVAGDVDHVVGAAEDEVVPVLVADSPVEGGVDQLALEVLEVGLHEALVVAPHRAHAARRQRRGRPPPPPPPPRHPPAARPPPQPPPLALDREAPRAPL